MTLFVVPDAWRAAYPEAVVGILALHGVANPAQHPALDARKRTLEPELRARYGAADPDALKQDPTLAAYDAYYRRFKKTYHVRHQLESVARKGKPIPGRAALVEAMFMAELANGLLTAGHDLDALRLPVRLDVASGDERYVLLNGAEQTTKAGDMLMVDGAGVISSIVYGPDARTAIGPATRAALFAVYGVPGITPDAMRAHLAAIRDNVCLVSPDAEEVACLTVTGAG